MPKQTSKISFAGMVSLGIGTMIGAGIFALLGEAGAIAGSAAWIAFVAGGLVALLSGYSLGRLGARYPSAGGIVDYLVQSWGDGLLSGGLSVLLYISALVSLSLVASAFGSYGAALHPGAPGWLAPALAVSVLLAFTVINLAGSGSVAKAELVIVALKFVVLLVLSIGALSAIDTSLLAPSTYPAPTAVLSAVGVTFFAYSGFSVITNAAEDVDDPHRAIPRAIMVAIGVVMVLYVLIAVAVFGTLSPETVSDAKEYALAESARPVFGTTGFTIVSITAMIATASAINAALYSSTNIAYQMAKDGELPALFSRTVAHSRDGLLVSGSVSAAAALTLDVAELATLGAASMLIVQGVTHLGHLRVAKETGASRLLVLLATLASLGAAVVSLVGAGLRASLGLALLVALALGTELLIRRLSGRTLTPR